MLRCFLTLAALAGSVATRKAAMTAMDFTLVIPAHFFFALRRRWVLEDLHLPFIGIEDVQPGLQTGAGWMAAVPTNLDSFYFDVGTSIQNHPRRSPSLKPVA